MLRHVRDVNLNDVRVFEANTNRDASATNQLDDPITLQTLRLVVVEYFRWPALRWSVIGCSAHEGKTFFSKYSLINLNNKT